MSVTGIHSLINHGGTTVGSLWNHHRMSFQQDLPKFQDRSLDKIGAVSIRRKPKVALKSTSNGAYGILIKIKERTVGKNSN